MDFIAAKKETKTQKTAVSAETLAYLWKLRYENATVGACCTYLTSRILGQGVYFESKSGKKPSLRFNAHVNDFFLPFAKKAIDALLVQGFVVYNVELSPQHGDYPIPYILSGESFEVNVVHTERGFSSLVVSDKAGKRRKKCFTHMLDMPSERGTCTSKVALVSNAIAYMEEVEKQD